MGPCMLAYAKHRAIHLKQLGFCGLMHSSIIDLPNAILAVTVDYAQQQVILYAVLLVA